MALREDGYYDKGAARAAGATRDESESPTPEIRASGEDLAQTTSKAWDSLIRANDPAYLFRHGSRPARIEQDDEGRPVIQELNPDRMRYELARSADWFNFNKQKKKVPAPPPMLVVRDVLATPNPPLPVLTRVVESPLFSPDGTLADEPGYNLGTQTFYAPIEGFICPKIGTVTKSDIEGAESNILVELLGDFPFVDQPEIAHSVALLLLPFVRELIKGPTPLHLIEKPSPGTGASLLVDVITRSALGRPVAAITEGRDEDEWRKRITSLLRGGPTVVLIDNLRSRLESSALSAVITQNLWEDRLLGRSEQVRLPVRCAWVATGNNPALSSEIARRTVRIRLDAKQDRPWLREGFRHPNLPQWATDNRDLLVWSALVLIKAWLQDGRPKGSSRVTLGMFEGWASVMGGILAVAGIDGFLGNLDEFYEESDTEGAIWRSFVEAWAEKFGDREVGVANLWSLTNEMDQPLDLGDKGDRSQKIRLGIMLKNMRDRRFHGWQISAGGKVKGAQQWRLRRFEE